MNLCVFCSANEHIDPDFFSLTRSLGEHLAHEGHTVVFGGCDMGLMRCLAESVTGAGGEVVGVVPHIVEEGVGASSLLTRVISCSDLNERKSVMMEESDLFLVLPGGIGTLDELFTVAASASIGYHHKRIVLYNMKGFWSSLTLMLSDLEKRGMIRGQWTEYIEIADTLEEVSRLIKNAEQRV